MLFRCRLQGKASTALAMLLCCAVSCVCSAAFAESLVLEAEHANEIKLNYEIKPDGRASGGLVLSAWEGAGHVLTFGRTNVDPDVFIGEARLDFEIAKPGAYFISARVFFRDKCGNSVYVGLDGGPQIYLACDDAETDRMGKWHWERVGPFRLTAGAHTIAHKVLEDGVLIDQWCIHEGHRTPKGILKENWPGRFQRAPLKTITVSFSKDSELIQPDGLRPLTLWARKNVEGPVMGRIVLNGPEDMSAAPAGEIPVAFQEDETLKRLDVTLAFPRATPRTE